MTAEENNREASAGHKARDSSVCKKKQTLSTAWWFLYSTRKARWQGIHPSPFHSKVLTLLVTSAVLTLSPHFPVCSQLLPA